MFATATIALLGIFTVIATHRTQKSIQPLSKKVSARLQALWDDATKGIREKKYLRAEKALLTILRFDQKNAAAYNRLGILYAKQKEFKDAIHCFEVASSIEPSASSLHNLGLIYYETESYEKANRAFEEALELEDNLAARHIAYAKVQEKLDNNETMIEALETAVKLEPNPQTFNLLADAHDRIGEHDEALKVRKRLDALVAQAKTTKQSKKVHQPRKVVM